MCLMEITLFNFKILKCNVVAVSNTYRDDISDGYSIPDEIPTTCFRLCELV